jgi:hypothetical protein
MNFIAIKDRRMSCEKMHFYAPNSLNLTYFSTTERGFEDEKNKVAKKIRRKNLTCVPFGKNLKYRRPLELF